MFRKAYRLPFTLLGIPVLLDATFLIVLPVFAFSIAQRVEFWAHTVGVEDHPSLHHTWMPYLLGLVTALGLFTSVLVHELGHSVVARLYGVKVRSITLWLLGGVAAFDEMPRQRGAEAVVAIAGPIVSIAVGVLCWLALRALPQGAVPARFVFTYLAGMNVALALFNMLPALPLDGGRVLRSLLALRMSHLRATRVAGGVSKFLAVLLGLWGLASLNVMLVLVAFFVYMAANSELRTSAVTELLDGLRVADVMGRPPVAVPHDFTVGELAQTAVMLGQQQRFAVERGGQLVGMVCLEDLQGRPVPPATRVEEVMRAQLHAIRTEAPALDALQRMSRNGYPRLLVVEPSGQVVGMVTNTDLMRAIETRTAGLGWGVRDGEGARHPRIAPARTDPPAPHAPVA
jgi:Zn-dependent protease/predicted transcriptional regulator